MISRERLKKPIAFLEQDMVELLQQTAAIKHTVDYWSYVADRCAEIAEKYDNAPFVKHMLLAYIDYLDKMATKGRR